MLIQKDNHNCDTGSHSSINSIDWDITLVELSAGLAQLLEPGRDGRTVEVYPRRLRLGISRLAAAMIRAGARPIYSIPDAIRMLQEPVGRWDVSPRPPEYMSATTLMDGEYITEDADELIIHNPDISGELTQRIMLRVIENCRVRGDQEGYVRFRGFVIEHPVASQMEFIKALNSLGDEDLRTLLNEAYEEVPNPPTSGEDISICERCGWTLPRVLDRNPSRCGNRRCLQLDGVQSPRFLGKRSWEPGLRRVKTGLARYTSQPGGLEMRLYGSLAELKQLRVELWPGYDAYDIGITFPDGETWAVDCKDSGRPELLAALLGREEFPMSGSWQRAFYVFPDYRRELNPQYGRIIKSRWGTDGRAASWRFDDEFLRMVKRRIRETGHNA